MTPESPNSLISGERCGIANIEITGLTVHRQSIMRS